MATAKEPQESPGASGLGEKGVEMRVSAREVIANQASGGDGAGLTARIVIAGKDVDVAAAAASGSGEEKVGDEVEVQVPMGKNSIEVQEAGNDETGPPIQEVTITTTAGENEAVVGPLNTSIQATGGDVPPVSTTAEDLGQTKAPKSCVVNMASVDDEHKGKRKKETPAKTNGSVRAKKNSEASAKTGEPKKRGRKPGKASEKGKQGDASRPFTLAQQFQLRAQILVYGALIQSSLPDDSLMAASFVDAMKVRSLETYESHYGSTRSVWEKIWKGAHDRIAKATGHPPKLVGFSAAHAPTTPTVVRPPSPCPAAPPKSGSKGKSSTSAGASEFPTVTPPAGFSNMAASATVSSWSARARSPDPNAWNLYSGPRFPYQPPQGTIQGWGTASPAAPPSWGQGTFAPGAFVSPVLTPAPVSSPPSIAASGVTEPPTKKRKKDEGGVAADTTKETGTPLALLGAEKLSTLEDYVGFVEQAKQTAEEAVAASASIVEQTQRMWEKTKAENGAGEKEMQIAACVASTSAALSAAKAASAAANVAYAAALQARAIAAEASKARDDDPSVTHVTQGDEQWDTIAGVKGAARGQAIAASFLLQRTDNIATILRAAELACEAAHQAGALAAICDARGGKNEADKEGSKSKTNKRSATVRRTRAQTKKTDRDGEKLAEKSSEHANTNTNDATMEDAEQQPSEAVPKGDEAEPPEGMVENRQQYKPVEIKQGSHVEILPGEEEGLQGVWFSAKVLEINGDRALVVYDDLLDESNPGHLQEWVDLNAQTDNVPRVRIAHPMTMEASARKRRRAAMGNQIWLKGDHVDVWMRDGWWEGVVQSVEEEKVTVFFPADGDSEVTKSWNLRPSLIWHEGAWIPWRETQPKEKVEGSRLDGSPEPLDTELPKQRGSAKPTKTKKFSDVMEKEHEASMQKKKLLDEQRQQNATAKTSAKKPSPKSGKKSTPVAKKSTSAAEKKRSTSSEVTSDAEGEVRKSGRTVQPTSKLLEALRR